MSFPRYECYKDSGVEWLGEVPEGWEVAPFKWQIERNDGGIWGSDPDGKDDTLVLRSTEQTVGGLWKIEDPAYRRILPLEKAEALLAVGDLLVTKSSGSSLHIGKTSLVTEEIAAMGCCYSNFMQRLRLKPSFIPKFAWYVMNNDLARIQLDYLSNSTTGLANLNSTMIGEIIIVVPSHLEQQFITSFLDHEAGKIDALIMEQELLIDLLKEKRQAVITHAVTKGLNPDAPLKDSGIEWLGKAPEHWKITRLANLFHEAIEKGSSDLPFLSVSIHHGVSDRELDEEERDRKVIRSEDPESNKRVRPGDLVYNMMRAWQGGFGAVKTDGMVSPAYVVARPRIDLSTSYIELLLRTPQAIEEMRRYSRGVTDFRLRLYWDSFKDICIALPPLAEMDEIINKIGVLNGNFSALITESVSMIVLLKERRSALISAAVTGKIDVRSFNDTKSN